MSQIHVHWWHFSEVIGYYGFWWCFITKVCFVDHLIIVVYIYGVSYRGSSEMSQIHTHWWHFSEVIGYCWFWWCFDTKIWFDDHIIIVVYINGVSHRGSFEMSQIWVRWSHFWRLLVLVVCVWVVTVVRETHLSLLHEGGQCHHQGGRHHH